MSRFIYRFMYRFMRKGFWGSRFRIRVSQLGFCRSGFGVSALQLLLGDSVGLGLQVERYTGLSIARTNGSSKPTCLGT